LGFLFLGGIMKRTKTTDDVIRVVIGLALIGLWWKEMLFYWKVVVSFLCLGIYLWTLNITEKSARIAIFATILAAILALIFSQISG
jgi:hypothetical protein